MSQRKEKFARDMRRVANQHQLRINALETRMDLVGEITSILWEHHLNDTDDKHALVDYVSALKREQRRRRLSHERITMLLCATALLGLLVWVSLEIFRMV